MDPATPIEAATERRTGEPVPFEAVKRYLLANFEQAFVLVILVAVALVTYFIPYKLAFLNFFFIPVLLGAYYLDARRAILGAVFCAIMVAIHAGLKPEAFAGGKEHMEIWLGITTWAGFLILSGALVGRLHSRLQREFAEVRDLNDELKRQRDSLEAARSELKAYSANLEAMVGERTEKLEQSKRTIEQLKEKVEDTLYSTMDPAVAKLIIEERLRTEKRRISLMFTDLMGFTGYSEERQPETVIGELNRYLGEMEQVLLDYRGHIDKYLGDGIMVEFGAPVDHQRHALQAVMAGLKMQERLSKARAPLRMRVGISTGDPIIGLIGRQRQTYTAIGDIVNLASRIQERCAPGKVTVDEATWGDVSRFFDAKPMSLFPFSEFDDPEYARTLERYFLQLEENPKDLPLLKKAAFLLMYGKDFVQAHELFRRALELDADDERVKLAFAETSLHISRMGEIAVKGKRKRLHLFEIAGLRNPFQADRVPPSLVAELSRKAARLAEYPEDLVLPVECLDGCVGHSRVVGLLSLALAEALDLADQEKKDVLQAGYLADIGKSIVPHHMLNRAGSLSRAEFEEVKKHPREGVRVLRTLGFENKGLLEIVGAHHEHHNGTGYPEGLSGERVPVGARLVAVAEEYDALTAWRPYRDAWEPRAAFEQIADDTRKGKFDPKVVEALSRLLELPSRAA